MLQTSAARAIIGALANDTRSCRFTLTVKVEPGHPAYEDPEWAADAAGGALTNEYGLRAISTNVEEIQSKPL